MANAIERERARSHDQKMTELQLDYKRSSDAQRQANWDKEFDIKKSQAQTQEQLQQAALTTAEQKNKLLKNEVEHLITDMSSQENYNRIIAQKVQNLQEERSRKKEIDARKKDADSWFFGKDATADLNQQARDAGLKSSWGSVGDAVYDFFDHNFTGVNNYQGLATAQAEQSPSYTSQQQMVDQGILAGGMSPELASIISGQDFHTQNAIQSMPPDQQLNWMLQLINQNGGYGQ